MPISPISPPGAGPVRSQSLESLARQKNGVSHPLPTSPAPPKIDIAPTPTDKGQQSSVLGSKVNKTA